VDDLFADVERLLVDIESNIDNVDCTHYAGAETAGLGEKNLFERHKLKSSKFKVVINQGSLTHGKARATQDAAL
jgi:hypothetical protein